MKSAYELERDNNIARNNAMLEALGLAGDNSLKPKRQKTAPKPDDFVDDAEPIDPSLLRRSSRVAGVRPDYAELSDAFCREEERKAEGKGREIVVRHSDRPQRARSAPELYSNVQAAGQVTRPRVKRPVTASQPVVQTVVQTVAVQSFAPVFVAAPEAVDPNEGRGYKVDGEWGRCPRCNQVYVKRKSGLLRKHDCFVQAAAPILPFCG